jgi:hypothetical protein
MTFDQGIRDRTPERPLARGSDRGVVKRGRWRGQRRGVRIAARPVRNPLRTRGFLHSNLGHIFWFVVFGEGSLRPPWFVVFGEGSLRPTFEQFVRGSQPGEGGGQARRCQSG